MKKTFLMMIFFLFLCSKDYKHIKSSGIIEGIDIDLRTKVSGQILKLYVHEGDVVKKFDTIAVLDDTLLNIQKQKVIGTITQLKAKLNLLLNGARIEDLDIAKQNLKKAREVFVNLEKEYNRMKALHDQKAISDKTFDNVTTKYEEAKSSLNIAKLNLAKLQKFARPEEIDMAKAQLDAAIAELDLINKHISYTKILAPINGYITDLPYREYESIPQGGIIANITRTDSVYTNIYLKEPTIVKLRINQKVKVYFDDKDNSYDAKIIYISPVAEFVPKNVQTDDQRSKLVFKVKLGIANKDFIFKPGLPVNVIIDLK